MNALQHDIMKRDLDLIRYILQEAEANSASGTSHFEIRPPEGTSMVDLLGHADLLIDAGFIDADYSDASTARCYIKRLKWDGHEFLDASRDDSLWKKAKKAVITQTGAWTVSLLLEYLKQTGRDRLGLPIP